TGMRAKGEEGSMGSKRYGVRGPVDGADPHVSRQQALRESQEFGMIGLLGSGAGGDPDAPAAPWGRDSKTDGLSARGNVWGDAIGDAKGGGGLGLGGIGGIGHGAGTGTGQGFGSGAGRRSGQHQARSASPSYA